MFPKVKTYVDESFAGKHVKHFDRTVHWVKVLRPDADDALIIAAYAHDIERGLRKPEHQEIYHNSAQGFQDEAFLTHHQEEGARLIGEFLEKEGVNTPIIKRVKTSCFTPRGWRR